MNTLVPVEETPRPVIRAGARPQAIVPQTMEEAYRMAIAVCKAGMAPKGMDSPEACMIAIMHGLEIGLNPMSALQRIAVVNGRPTIWGDAAIGLVRASGLCEGIDERTEGRDADRIAICEVKRKGELPITRTFSVADAKKAGLWGKSGPWSQYPERMLQMRARAFALRDGFADVLGGLYLREEFDEEERETRRRAKADREPPAPFETKPEPAKIESKPATTTKQPEPAPFVMDALTAAHTEFAAKAKDCKDVDELVKVWEIAFDGFYNEDAPTEQKNSMDRAFRLAEENLPTGDDEEGPPCPN
jgi:hypothetical protein